MPICLSPPPCVLPEVRRVHPFRVFDRCYLDHHEDGVRVWRARFDQFCVTDWAPVSGGTAVWGETPTWSSEQTAYPWLARVDQAGNVLWQRPLEHGFERGSISAVVDNGDGTWAVFSRGDFETICLSRFSETGEELSFRKTELNKNSIRNAVPLGEGYLVQLDHGPDGELAHLVRLDRERAEDVTQEAFLRWLGRCSTAGRA